MAEAFSEYQSEFFEFDGKQAQLVIPHRPDGRGSWAIYTEYFGAFPVVAEELLRRGYHIARLENDHRWGSRADRERRLRFADHMERDRGLAHRCLPIGMSCGGLHAIQFAADYPDRVSALYLDAPVVNLLSCPMAYGRPEDRDEGMVQECLKALNMTESQMLGYREHPLDALPRLVQARVPVGLVYGDSDPVVPYGENGALLAKVYLQAGVPIRLYGKPGCAHHPHGLEDPTELVDFLISFSNN